MTLRRKLKLRKLDFQYQEYFFSSQREQKKIDKKLFLHSKISHIKLQEIWGRVGEGGVFPPPIMKKGRITLFWKYVSGMISTLRRVYNKFTILKISLNGAKVFKELPCLTTFRKHSNTSPFLYFFSFYKNWDFFVLISVWFYEHLFLSKCLEEPFWRLK